MVRKLAMLLALLAGVFAFAAPAGALDNPVHAGFPGPVGHTYKVTGFNIQTGATTTTCMSFSVNGMEWSGVNGGFAQWDMFSNFSQISGWSAHNSTFHVVGHTFDGGHKIRFQVASATSVVRGEGMLDDSCLP